jgi:hypothetical protein
MPDLRQAERLKPVVIHGRGPDAELNEPGVIIPASCPQAAQVALEDDLLKARQVPGRDEAIEGGIWHEVPGVFTNGPEAGKLQSMRATWSPGWRMRFLGQKSR